MYEHRKQPLASKATFYQRILKNIVIALIIMAICLVIGIAGYHYTADISWLDALHNASMILSGMGPVVEIKSDTRKMFSSAYALFSGVYLSPMSELFLRRLFTGFFTGCTWKIND